MTQTVLLGDICDVRDGTHDSPKPKDSGHPLVTSKHIKNYKIDFSTANLISNEDFKVVNKRSKVDKNDILISMIGTVGELALIDYEPVFAIKNIGLIKTGDELLGKYLFYYLQGTKAKQYIESSLAGSTQKFISLGQLRKLPVVLPDQKTQKKIAHILGTIDEKIELNRKMNETLEQMGQALFRHYFIDNPEAKNWEEVKIGELVSIKGGGTPSTKDPDLWNGGVAWTSPRDLTGTNNIFLHQTGKTITEKGLAKISSGLLPVGTLLLSSRAPIGYIAFANVPLAINQGYIAFLPDAELSNSYTFFWLRQNMLRIKNVANGSTFMEISKTAFRNISALKPTVEALEKFDTKVVALLEQVKNNEVEILTLTALRDTLLPRLISGKTSIVNEHE